jgi:hypothetical protein
MNGPTSSLTPAERFFYGLAENVFQVKLGIANTYLIDYLSRLLVRFIRYDALFRMRTLQGRPLTEVGDMIIEAKQMIGKARCDAHQHIGDFALFWTGVYPEAFRSCRQQGIDHYTVYCRHGKKAYEIAAEMAYEFEEIEHIKILLCLSCHFDMWAYGLREVRRTWEKGGEEETSSILLV